MKKERAGEYTSFVCSVYLENRCFLGLLELHGDWRVEQVNFQCRR
jgi:hypothetical protein